MRKSFLNNYFYFIEKRIVLQIQLQKGSSLSIEEFQKIYIYLWCIWLMKLKATNFIHIPFWPGKQWLCVKTESHVIIFDKGKN